MLTFPYALVGLALFAFTGLVLPVWAGGVLSVEVFTTSERSFNGVDHERLGSATATTYVVDALKHLEMALSEGLPTDSEIAKVEAFQRFQRLDDDGTAPAKNAAIGLAKAIQYGVDRHPAIVFDGLAVVYGVTDLVEALDRYEAWQREQAR